MGRSKALPALVALVVLLVPATALADHGQDVARGNYRSFTDLVSFSASSNANGTQADGHFKEVVQSFDPNLVIEGDVTCLLVVNNVATLGGEVTRVRPSGVFTGVRGFTLTVTDSGKFAPAPDLTSFISYSATPPAACTPITFQSPITEGEIIVHDSL